MTLAGIPAHHKVTLSVERDGETTEFIRTFFKPLQVRTPSGTARFHLVEVLSKKTVVFEIERREGMGSVADQPVGSSMTPRFLEDK